MHFPVTAGAGDLFFACPQPPQPSGTRSLLASGDAAQSPRPAETREEKRGEKEEPIPGSSRVGGEQRAGGGGENAKASSRSPARRWLCRARRARRWLSVLAPLSPTPPLPLVPSMVVMLAAASLPAPGASAQHTLWCGRCCWQPGLSPCRSFPGKPGAFWETLSSALPARVPPAAFDAALLQHPSFDTRGCSVPRRETCPNSVLPQPRSRGHPRGGWQKPGG